MEKSTMSAPFKNINVLDFAWAGVGSFCVNYLAWFGATVVKLESKKRPDITRLSPPYKDNIPGVDRSLYFAWTHPAKKHDITINLGSEKGIEITKKLVQWADVIVESFVAGTMEKWGLGYEDIVKINPEVIMLRTCTHGQTGALARQPALGFTLSTLSGFNNLTGWPDRQTNEVHGAYTDFIAPLFGTTALIAALDYKRRTGKGQLIDLAQHEASLQFIAPLLLNSAVNKVDPQVCGNDSDRAVPHGVYPCQGDERWCAIAVADDTQWESLCHVMGNPSWTKDEKLCTLEGRLEFREVINTRLEAFTREQSVEALVQRLQAAGVPAGVVSNAKDLAENPQLKHYQFYRTLDHPGMGRCSFYQAPPFNLSKAPAKVAPPPLLGEHTHYICSQFLNLSEDEIETYARLGTFD